MMPQPKQLYFLNFVSMWECFSYYGMRTLLVLFLVQEFQLSDSAAFSLYAAYTALVEFGGIFGGMAADRFLGLKRAIFLGGILITCGHLSLLFLDFPLFFFFGLGLIIVGTSLFRPNIPALMGKFYENEDPRRDSGYTLYYAGINLGGFLAAILCGIAAENYGFSVGFGLAALGMIAGMVTFCLKQKKYFSDVEEVSLGIKKEALLMPFLFLLAAFFGLALYSKTLLMPLLSSLFVGVLLVIFKQLRTSSFDEKKGLKAIFMSLFFLVIFYACEEQIGSLFILFADRHVEGQFLFFPIPASSFSAFNPLTILVLGPFLAALLKRESIKTYTKFAISFLFLAAAFLLLYFTSFLGTPIFSGYLIGSIALISLGELFIGPTIYANAAKNAPKRLQGLAMGMVTFGFSLASLAGGFLSQMVAVTEESSTIHLYRQGFLFLALIGGITFTISLISSFYHKNRVIP